MSAKAICEATGKDLLNRFLNSTAITSRFISVNENANLKDLAVQNAWLKMEVNFDFLKFFFFCFYKYLFAEISHQT